MTTHIFAPLENPSPTNDNAVAISSFFANGGPGATVLLLDRCSYPVYSPVSLGQNSHLATQGYPTFESGNQAILETLGEKEATAVRMFNVSDSSIRNIHVKGNRGWGKHSPSSDEEKEKLRKQGALGWIEGGGALILMGGPLSRNCLLEGCRLEDPRGWTACHVADWANDSRLLNNVVGPCGQQAGAGPWADGLSIAGINSTVDGNTIIDATDGAIVVFCATGSIISNNLVIARTRDCLGAINMVDDFPCSQDYTNTRVISNTIRTEGAYIRLGIGIGMTCWSPWNPQHTRNFGGFVLNNTFGPGKLGYGIGVSGAIDFTVQGNVVLPGTDFCGATDKIANCAPPTAFLIDRQRTQNCRVQDGFVDGVASWLIGVEPQPGSSLTFRGGQLALDYEGKGNCGDGGITLKDSKVLLDRAGILSIREDLHSVDGKVLWSSGTGRAKDDYHPSVTFSSKGELAIKSAQGTTLWSPTDYIQPYLDKLRSLDPSSPDDLASPSATIASLPPYVTIQDAKGNVLYSTQYEFRKGFTMTGGNWIAVAPVSYRGVQYGTCAAPALPERPHQASSFLRNVVDSATSKFNDLKIAPPIPPRPSQSTSPARVDRPHHPPTFLLLNPATAQLVLHSSASPAHPTPENIHWVSSPLIEGCEVLFLSFQGDGNLVLYAKKGGVDSVAWASGTNGDEEHAGDRIVLRGVDEGGRAFLIVDKHGREKYSGRG